MASCLHAYPFGHGGPLLLVVVYMDEKLLNTYSEETLNMHTNSFQIFCGSSGWLTRFEVILSSMSCSLTGSLTTKPQNLVKMKLNKSARKLTHNEGHYSMPL